jgi:hypothetical protein
MKNMKFLGEAGSAYQEAAAEFEKYLLSVTQEKSSVKEQIFQH